MEHFCWNTLNKCHVIKINMPLCAAVLSYIVLISSSKKDALFISGFYFTDKTHCGLTCVGVTTHGLSSVSLFAGGTNWAGSTRSAWSARSTSSTSVTTITLQHREHRTNVPVFGVLFWLAFFLSRFSHLDSSRTISSRRTIRSRVSLSDDSTILSVNSFHIPQSQMSCWMLISCIMNRAPTKNINNMAQTQFKCKYDANSNVF